MVINCKVSYFLSAGFLNLHSYCNLNFLKYSETSFVFQLNRVKAVEKEKDDLEGPKNEAVEYLKLENSMSVSGISLCI